MNAKTTRKKTSRKKTTKKAASKKGEPAELAAGEPRSSQTEAGANEPIPPISLAALTGAFLAHLETIGKSRGTVFSYSVDAGLALKHFGLKRTVESLTPDDVAIFFESDVVTKTRTGRRKADATIAKTRRVLRLMLNWAAERGEIAAAPLPAK